MTPREQEAATFLEDLLEASGIEVIREGRFLLPSGSVLEADIVARDAKGDLLIFELGKASPEKTVQLDRIEKALGVRPRLVDVEPLLRAMKALEARNAGRAAAVINDKPAWYLRIVGAARQAGGTIARGAQAILGRLRVIEIRFDHETSLKGPAGVDLKTRTGFSARVEFEEPNAPPQRPR